jgi:hypothetical protein
MILSPDRARSAATPMPPYPAPMMITSSIHAPSDDPKFLVHHGEKAYL